VQPAGVTDLVSRRAGCRRSEMPIGRASWRPRNSVGCRDRPWGAQPC